MMSSLPVAGGDASTASGPEVEDNDAVNCTDEKPRTVQRRMAAAEAGKRQRSSVSAFVSGYTDELPAPIWQSLTAVSQ